ncbi:MAG: hypothetical protein Q7N50_12990 [Armatimonadota bacterium]|nr:hypothetical protein [Armatimonadota bacterium]
MQSGINGLAPASRLCFTFFLIAVILGVIMAAGQHIMLTGLNCDKTAANYLGGEVGDMIQVEKPVQDMFRVAHVHLLGIGLVLFALCRVFIMVPISDRAKSAFIGAAFGLFFLQVGSPWLVRFVSARSAILVIISGLLFSAALVAMSTISLYHLWKSNPKKT